MIEPNIISNIDSEDNNVEEEILFTSLRAQDWEEFYGQKTIKHSLQISIEAAKQRNETLDHILLYGPPGLGKTTLSHIIAKEMGVNIKITSGTALTKSGDLAAILTNLEDGDILFIDEIHRLSKAVEETLYPAMEDYALDIVIGKGPSARTVRIDLPKFTLIGATTRFGLLSGPFRDRFGLIQRLEFYPPEGLQRIITNGAKKLKVTLDPTAALSIARRSRGTPRIALKLFKRVRDYAQIKNGGDVTPESVEKALDMFAIDSLGLDHNDRRLLIEMIDKHSGGPVGLSTMSATIHEDSGTIEEVIEPYLIQIGFLKRTNQGRVVSEAGYAHLGITYKK
ncbi:MAG: Holliday junction branch migration DNA helicase RuvB [Candidatus Pacebacteria bacterium]|jgi:holliday junction DNA helicase RuvB|nr:Holliday junction branch migration DNA helicase RuvB [Candidatus Paceibacterota bacterium]MBT4652063.1 Holliday junction branch migration DNA helicase RuvB [Candidatus Paceibacterota bacterium]MBT6756085.1 Holliday junction branch migration DNA helicase RuvB [Candidatus Paceibacterota bacterium]MBT6921678.1 Holliday junction branch migration DNA helicase RuvB [Candidatus Paceibacterota bacterium]